MGTVLLIDDEEDLLFSLTRVIQKHGGSTLTATTGRAGLEILHSTVVDLVFLDIGLPDTSGLELIGQIRRLDPEVEIIMLTGDNDARSAVQALRNGATDYIVKPFDLLEFATIYKRSIQSRLRNRQALLSRMQQRENSLLGRSKPMLRVFEGIGRAAEVDSAVLITGETGTGKELVARTIHETRYGPDSVFVKVDCGTLSANLIESELFGHERGAFTDAREGKKGLVEVASGGTLFLDEIGNMPIDLQPKLLRLIEESTFRRLGGLTDITVKIRVIAATNADLPELIQKGQFRQDLYYRLNVIPIPLPPLRKRGDDVLLLAEAFLDRLNRELKKQVRGFTPGAQEKLLQYPWPGNIRELRNLIEREIIFCRSDLLRLDSLQTTELSPVEATPLCSLQEAELSHIQNVLTACGGNKSKAARILGISRTTLRDKLTRQANSG